MVYLYEHCIHFLVTYKTWIYYDNLWTFYVEWQQYDQTTTYYFIHQCCNKDILFQLKFFWKMKQKALSTVLSGCGDSKGKQTDPLFCNIHIVDILNKILNLCREESKQ